MSNEHFPSGIEKPRKTIAIRVELKRPGRLGRWLCRHEFHRWVYASSGLDRGCARCGRQEMFSSVVGTWLDVTPPSATKRMEGEL